MLEMRGFEGGSASDVNLVWVHLWVGLELHVLDYGDWCLRARVSVLLL